jgi:hypothetical protein
MSNKGEAPAPKSRKLPTYEALREMLWLPKLSLWGLAGTALFVVFVGFLIFVLLIK